jgi:hypothetical protein
VPQFVKSGWQFTVVALVHDVVVHTVPDESLLNMIVGVYEVVPKSSPEMVTEMPPLDTEFELESSVILPAMDDGSMKHATTIQSIVLNSFPILIEAKGDK